MHARGQRLHNVELFMVLALLGIDVAVDMRSGFI